ncbi:MAG: SPOR domain-containing protein, partial [Reyranellaceae bacterium]
PQSSPSIATLIDTLSGHRIQLASVRTEEQAKATWARLQQSNGDVLGKLTMRAVRVDLGERGTYYRVQAGPLDESGAQSACATLRGRSVECLVVKP